MLTRMQPSLLLLILLFAYSHTVKPPGYVEPQSADEDPRPPKYEYGYNIIGDKGGEQGKQEQRDGIYASGRYFVQNKDARQDVQYFADDWGYHPAVEYANVGPHSKSSTKFALGHEAVVQLRNRENNLPQLEGLPDTGPLKKDAPLINTDTKPLTSEPQNYQPTLLLPQPSQQSYNEQPVEAVTSQPSYDPYKQQEVLIHQQQIHLQQPNIVYEQPKEEQQFIYKQQPQQQIIQHIQQPVENVIFPQSTPSPVDHNPTVLLEQQQQPNIVLVGQEAGKLVQSEEQSNNYQQFGLKLNSRRPNKLIASTQHLVTGQDVLDINHSAAAAAVSTSTYEDFGVKSTTPYPTATEITVTEPSFIDQPIVAAEIENKIISTTESILKEQEQFVSTTASTIEAVSTTFEQSSPTPTIVVTPRPVSTTFLAPITAGLRLESTEHGKYKLSQQNVQIEVQKSVPYYFGQNNYPFGYITKNHSCVDHVKNNLDLEKGLLYFPGQYAPPQQLNEIDNHINIQQLPSPTVANQFVELDQQVAQGYQHQVVFQQQPIQQQVIHQQHYQVPAVPQPYPVEKPVHVPVQVTKYIDRPYPVEVRVPYPVEKIVQRIVKQPYPVEVRVPVHIDRIVEKKVPHYIEKPVTVEKIVEKPVTQYVDRPYPVHIKVPVPTPVAVPVDRIVERKIPVPHYIEKPVAVERVVEKPVPQYIDRPYPVEVKVPVPQPYYVKVEVPRRYHTQFIQRPWNYGGFGSNFQAQLQQIYQNLNSQVQTGYLSTNKDALVQSSYSNIKDSQASDSYTNIKQTDGYHYPKPYEYAPQNNFYLPPKQEFVVNKEYLPPVAQNCDHAPVQSNDNNYIGLLPPKAEQKYLRKYRSARSNFNDKNIRMEYGFMPPLVPSLEIDEQGQPIEKGEK